MIPRVELDQLLISMNNLVRWRPHDVKTFLIAGNPLFRGMRTGNQRWSTSTSDFKAKRLSVTGKERREVVLASEDKPTGALQYTL